MFSGSVGGSVLQSNPLEYSDYFFVIASNMARSAIQVIR